MVATVSVVVSRFVKELFYPNGVVLTIRCEQDLSPIINTNGNSFVGITIQYRLGAFGFLSSDEVYRKGVANAGILDQHFALQWVQNYAHLFNGDPTKVTISGESAGGTKN